MMRRSSAVRIQNAAVTFCLLALLASAWVFGFFPIHHQGAQVWVILPLMALMAEFIPVELSQGGVRITFTLPYVAGMAVAVGPSGALLTDVLVTLAAGSYLLAKRRTSGSLMWAAMNAAVAALSAAFGAFGFAVLHRIVPTGSLGLPAECIGFMVFYGVANFMLVMYLEMFASRGSISDQALQAIKIGVRSIGFYALVALGVSILIRDNLPYLAPLTLVPVWALRAGLQYQARMYDHYCETITALTQMLQRAHPYTHGHLERVARTAEEVARRLGLSRNRARLVREAAVLHDIGKIAVNEAVLDKPARLTETEMDHVRKHAAWGAQILSPVKQFSDIVPWIRHHHERIDGRGYPDRLSDVEIPIESKIIAVVDAFDAMTGTEHPDTHRSYRKPRTPVEAIQELERCSGTQFDAKVVKVFKEVVLGGAA
jgi:putative nucleotidyltransferase with HDIG domain